MNKSHISKLRAIIDQLICQHIGCTSVLRIPFLYLLIFLYHWIVSFLFLIILSSILYSFWILCSSIQFTFTPNPVWLHPYTTIELRYSLIMRLLVSNQQPHSYQSLIWIRLLVIYVMHIQLIKKRLSSLALRTLNSKRAKHNGSIV